MKEKTVTIYEDFAGNPHNTAAECTKWERENMWRRLIGLTEADVLAAVSYEDIEMSGVIETLARRIKVIRLERGDVKINRGGVKGENDDEAELPHPVGRDQPMTAEEAERHTRVA